MQAPKSLDITVFLLKLIHMFGEYLKYPCKGRKGVLSCGAIGKAIFLPIRSRRKYYAWGQRLSRNCQSEVTRHRNLGLYMWRFIATGIHTGLAQNKKGYVTDGHRSVLRNNKHHRDERPATCSGDKRLGIGAFSKAWECACFFSTFGYASPGFWTTPLLYSHWPWARYTIKSAYFLPDGKLTFLKKRFNAVSK